MPVGSITLLLSLQDAHELAILLEEQTLSGNLERLHERLAFEVDRVLETNWKNELAKYEDETDAR